MIRTAAVGVIAFCLGVVGAVHVRADEFKLTPSIAVREEYNDNIFFTSSDEEDDFITTIYGGLELVERTERLNIKLMGKIAPFFYADNNDLDEIDQNYYGDISYRLTERLNVSADALYREDNRPDRDVEETGLVQNNDTRKRQVYGAGMDYALTEKALVALSGSYQRDDWDSNDPEDEDLRACSAGLGYSYNLSKWVSNTVGRLGIGYANYDYETSETDYYFGTAGAEHLFSETLSVEVDIGARYTESTFDSPQFIIIGPLVILTGIEEKEDSGWGGVGKAALNYRGEKTHTSLRASHDIYPASGQRGVTQRTELVVNANHKLTEKLVIGFSAGYYHNQADADEFSAQEIDEDVFRFWPRFRWEFADNFTLEAKYRFTYEDDDAADTTASQNQVYVELAYGLPLFE